MSSADKPEAPVSRARRLALVRPARARAAEPPHDPHQEEALGKAYDARLVRRLWTFIQPHRYLFWLSVVCLPISSGLMLVQPYLLKVAIDRHVAVGDPHGLALIGLLYIGAVVGECGFFYAQYYLTMLVAQRTLADLRVGVFAHVQSLPMSYFDRNPIGRLVTRLTSDVDVLNEMFAAGAMTIFMDVLTMVGIVVIMVSINWRLALVAMAVMPVMLFGINFFRLAARRTYRTIRERIARLNAYLQEALSGGDENKVKAETNAMETSPVRANSARVPAVSPSAKARCRPSGLKANSGRYTPLVRTVSRSLWHSRHR